MEENIKVASISGNMILTSSEVGVWEHEYEVDEDKISLHIKALKEQGYYII